MVYGDETLLSFDFISIYPEYRLNHQQTYADDKNKHLHAYFPHFQKSRCQHYGAYLAVSLFVLRSQRLGCDDYCKSQCNCLFCIAECSSLHVCDEIIAVA